MSSPETAIIIGAGPSGLLTALALSKILKRVTLIEKHANFTPRGATFGLAPNGIKALNEIDPSIYHDLQKVGLPTPGGGLMLPWWEMRDVLLRKVTEMKTGTGGVVELITGRVFKSLNDDGTSVTVELEGSSATKDTEVIKGDFLVGCDGVHSSVREWLSLPPALVGGGRMFRGSVTVGDDHSDELQAVLKGGIVPITVTGVKGFFSLVFNFNEKTPGRLTWMVATTNDITEETTPLTLLEEADIDSEEKKYLLSEIFRSSEKYHMKPYLPTKVVDFSEDYLSGLQGRWGGKGLVTLLGDAAHAMRPTDGQGGNMAFEDVVVLYRVIVNGRSVQEALEEFERKRLPRVRKVHHSQRERYEERMRGGAANPLPEEFRAWLLAGV